MLQAGQKDWTLLRQFVSLQSGWHLAIRMLGHHIQKNESHACSPCFGLLSRPFGYFKKKHPFHPSELDIFLDAPYRVFLQGIPTEMAQKLPRWVLRRFAHPPDGGFLPAGFGSRGRLGLLLAQARGDAVGWWCMPRAPPAPRDRVVDKYNAKVFRVRFEKQEDVVRLQEPLPLESLGSARMTRKTA